LPKHAPYSEDFNKDKLSEYALTGGQIALVIKNAAFNAAAKENPILTMEDFVSEIKKELAGSFDSEKSMGFLS